jgi:Phage late control gene D protein (GPD).
MTVSETVTAGISVNGGPLQQVVIGGTKPATASAATGVPTDLRIQTSTENKAGSIEATVLSGIPTGATVSLVIDGRTVFTGTVRKSEPGVGDRQRITAFDTLHELKQTFVDISVDNAEPFAVVNDIARETGASVSFESEPTATRLSRSFTDKRADAAIDTLLKATDTRSVVTTDNRLLIAEPGVLGNDGDRSIERIIDLAAGSRRPPFESVQVIGNTATNDPPVSGEQARHLLSAFPVVAEAGSGQPTFVFEDDGITSQAEANTIAETLLSRLQKQQQGGFVKVVGRSEIRPFDTIRLPESQGGGRFLVDAVEHTISSTDGFTTRLELSAPIA